MKKDRKILIENTSIGGKEFLLEIEGGIDYITKCKADPNLPIYLVGIIQKGDAPNRNGRIYPFKILKKECDRYLAEEVKDAQSFGELDHPCLDREHFVMTNKGWKSIVDIEVGDIVMTLNPKTKSIEYHPVYDKLDNPYCGEMVKMSSQTFSSVATPNHKWLVEKPNNKNTEAHFVETKDLNTSHKIPIKGIWAGETKETIVLKGLENYHFKYGRTDLELPLKPFLKFLGLYLSEGWSSDYGVSISQCKKENFDLIRNIFIDLGVDVLESKQNKKSGEINWTISDVRIYNYLKLFGSNAFSKNILSEIKNLSKENLEILLEYMYLGDGYNTDYYTSSKQLADDVVELLFKCGYGATYEEKDAFNNFYTVKNLVTEEIEIIHNIKYYTKSQYKSNYEIIEKNKVAKGTKFYTIRKKERSYYDVADIKKESFFFDDRIYCITVENHTFLTMRDGKITWTGNCESTVPELKNAAMTIEDIWYKGTEVWGRIKLLNAYMPETAPGKLARGIILNGKTLGISSRALGSVYQDESGYDVVEDDLEIICWDLVSRPSTYDANLRLTESNKKLESFYDANYLTETKCFGNTCNIITSKKLIKESKFKSLTEEEKIYVECMGVEKFLQLKNK